VPRRWALAARSWLQCLDSRQADESEGDKSSY